MASVEGVTVHFRLAKARHRKLREFCEREGITVEAWVAETIAKKVEALK